jgi:hypothetical protein
MLELGLASDSEHCPEAAAWLRGTLRFISKGAQAVLDVRCEKQFSLQFITCNTCIGNAIRRLGLFPLYKASATNVIFLYPTDKI